MFDSPALVEERRIISVKLPQATSPTSRPYKIKRIHEISGRFGRNCRYLHIDQNNSDNRPTNARSSTYQVISFFLLTRVDGILCSQANKSESFKIIVALISHGLVLLSLFLRTPSPLSQDCPKPRRKLTWKNLSAPTILKLENVLMVGFCLKESAIVLCF